MWFGIAFGVSMVFVFIGFVVESAEFPLFSAIVGMLAGLATFAFGLISSIVRIFSNKHFSKKEFDL